MYFSDMEKAIAEREGEKNNKDIGLWLGTESWCFKNESRPVPTRTIWDGLPVGMCMCVVKRLI